MVRIELHGKKAERFLAAQKRAEKAPQSESLTFVVRSLTDVKAVAAYLGVEIPEGRGRFPIRRLEERVSELGHTLDRSEYGDSVSVLPGLYKVSLMELSGDRVIPRSGIVTGDQLREFTTGRGRPSKDVVATTAINVHGWGDTYLSDSVQVERQD